MLATILIMLVWGTLGAFWAYLRQQQQSLLPNNSGNGNGSNSPSHSNYNSNSFQPSTSRAAEHQAQPSTSAAADAGSFVPPFPSTTEHHPPLKHKSGSFEVFSELQNHSPNPMQYRQTHHQPQQYHKQQQPINPQPGKTGSASQQQTKIPSKKSAPSTDFPSWMPSAIASTIHGATVGKSTSTSTNNNTTTEPDLVDRILSSLSQSFSLVGKQVSSGSSNISSGTAATTAASNSNKTLQQQKHETEMKERGTSVGAVSESNRRQQPLQTSTSTISRQRYERKTAAAADETNSIQEEESTTTTNSNSNTSTTTTTEYNNTGGESLASDTTTSIGFGGGGLNGGGKCSDLALTNTSLSNNSSAHSAASNGGIGGGCGIGIGATGTSSGTCIVGGRSRNSIPYHSMDGAAGAGLPGNSSGGGPGGGGHHPPPHHPHNQPHHHHHCCHQYHPYGSDASISEPSCPLLIFRESPSSATTVSGSLGTQLGGVNSHSPSPYQSTADFPDFASDCTSEYGGSDCYERALLPAGAGIGGGGGGGRLIAVYLGNSSRRGRQSLISEPGERMCARMSCTAISNRQNFSSSGASTPAYASSYYHGHIGGSISGGSGSGGPGGGGPVFNRHSISGSTAHQVAVTGSSYYYAHRHSHSAVMSGSNSSLIVGGGGCVSGASSAYGGLNSTASSTASHRRHRSSYPSTGGGIRHSISGTVLRIGPRIYRGRSSQRFLFFFCFLTLSRNSKWKF